MISTRVIFQSGLYVFQVHSLSRNNSDMWLELRHNYQYVLSIWGHTDNDFAAAGKIVLVPVFEGESRANENMFWSPLVLHLYSLILMWCRVRFLSVWGHTDNDFAAAGKIVLVPVFEGKSCASATCFVKSVSSFSFTHKY